MVVSYYTRENDRGAGEDEDNKMGIIATGSGSESIPTIIRYDENLTPIWQVTLPYSIGGLTILEPNNQEKLFVAVTKDGTLLVFDQNGTLKYQDSLPDKNGGDIPIYGVKSGFIGEDRYAFSIGTLSGILLYECVYKK